MPTTDERVDQFIRNNSKLRYATNLRDVLGASHVIALRVIEGCISPTTAVDIVRRYNDEIKEINEEMDTREAYLAESKMRKRWNDASAAPCCQGSPAEANASASALQSLP